MATTRIEVRAGEPYPVLVGNDLLGEVPALIGAQAQRVAIIHPSSQLPRVTELRAMLAADRSAITVEIPDAEAAKSAEVAAYCWSVLGSEGFTRSDVVIAIGGGATTDVAGFVAATWLRGVGVLHVPTTLLAMVDAAVGGKTGINTAAGKNLVGAIHEPLGVVCDLSSLTTLPSADLVAGLAEVVKAGFIRDLAILEVAAEAVAGDAGVLTDPARAAYSPELREVVERAIAVKADVVAGDLRETTRAPGGREILNYGHTFGHAVETVSGYRWRHGEAVSIGMMYAAQLAGLVGRLSSAEVARHRELLSGLGLPTTYVGTDWEPLAAAMAVDKKARGMQLRFVVLDGIGNPGFLDGPDPDLLLAAYRCLAG